MTPLLPPLAGATTVPGFQSSRAYVIGVEDYGGALPRLGTPIRDATRLARILQDSHGYQVTLLTDAAATLAALTRLFTQTLPATIGPDDRVLVYFAGHGLALDGDDGPAGYLLPQDAVASDRASFLPMRTLADALAALPCRHLLLILDCCFGGAFRWAATRGGLAGDPTVALNQIRFERFVQSPAWQVLTSAAYDQPALDSAPAFGGRDDSGLHSPFAARLFDGLAGQADLTRDGGDGVITATELYAYLRDSLEPATLTGRGQAQTPGLWPLPKQRKGEYVFLVPGHPLNLPPPPPLRPEDNPWLGLQSYEETDTALFFGRAGVVAALTTRVAQQPLTVVTGASGTGKSSVVKAGLLPRLRAAGWTIAGPVRPGNAPREALASLLPGAADTPLVARVRAWRGEHPGRPLLLVVDQFEELVTLTADPGAEQGTQEELAALLAVPELAAHLVLTVRSDFEPQFNGADGPLAGVWRQPAARFVVPPLSQVDLRQVIDGPAGARTIYFEPESLVDRLIDEVIQTPGGLPLLSFTLSEMYLRYFARQDDNRALTDEDYRAVGGVAGALTGRANAEYAALDPAHRATMRRVTLRMVGGEGGDRTRRRVPQTELDYGNSAENARVGAVIGRLTRARLLVEGDDEAGVQYVEPAHDALVAAWDQLWIWIHETAELLPLQRRLSQVAGDWERAGRPAGWLWDDNPNLPRLEALEREPEPVLNRQETAFVHASAARRRFNHRVRNAFVALLVVVAGVAVVAALVANEQSRQANRAQATAEVRRQDAVNAQNTAVTASYAQATAEADAQMRLRVAQAEALAAESQVVGDSYPQRSLLLAIEAVTTTLTLGEAVVPAADERLRAQLGVVGGHVVSGRAPDVALAGLSPDGHWLVTGHQDGTVGVWDLQAGDPTAHPRLLADHTAAITAVMITADSQWLITGSDDHTVRLWDLRSAGAGTSRVLGRVADSAETVAVSPDGVWLIAGGTHPQIWNLHAPDPAGTPHVLPGHITAVRKVVITADSHWLVTSSDDTTRLWNLHTLDPTTTGRPLHGHVSPIYTAISSPDGRWLVTLTADNTGRLWDLQGIDPTTSAELRGHTDSIATAVFSADGHWLVTEGQDAMALVWNLHAPDPTRKAQVLRGHTNALSAGAITPDGRWLVTAGADRTARLWDLRAADPTTASRVLTGHTGDVTAARITPDGHWLVTGSADSTARLWDLAAADPPTSARVLRGHEGGIRDLRISADSHWLVTLGLDRTARLWDLRAADPTTTLPILGGHAASIKALALSPDARWLATGSDDATTRLWDLTTADPVAVRVYGAVRDKRWGIWTLAISADGRWLATGDAVGAVALRHLRPPDPAAPDESLGSVALPYQVALSPDGRWLAVGGGLNGVGLRNLQATNPTPEVSTLETAGMVNAVTFSPDGHWLAAGTELWDVRGHVSGAAARVLPHARMDRAVAFSPNGRWLVTGNDQGYALLWNLQKTDPTPAAQALGGNSGSPNAVAFTPDGHWLVTGGDDKLARLWNLQAGDPALHPIELHGHDGVIQALAVSPDGHWLATGSADHTARLWDLHASDLAASSRVLLGHTEAINAVAFSPDGHWLVTGGEDTLVRLWNLRLGELVSQACQVAGRNLTYTEWQQYLSGSPYRKICPNLPDSTDLSSATPAPTIDHRDAPGGATPTAARP